MVHVYLFTDNADGLCRRLTQFMFIYLQTMLMVYAVD